MALSQNQINMAIIQEWDTFHPVSYQTAASESLLHFIFRDMIYRDEKGLVKADLASRVPSFKNKLLEKVKGQKKLKATWVIQEKAVWSDGRAITCADWQLGWKVGLSDFVSKTEKNIYSKIESIQFDEKKSPKTCVVIYATDEWTFDRDLPPLLPSHLEKDIFEKNNSRPQQYEQSSNYFKNPTMKGLYSGPYIITEMKLGSHVVFEENPNFFGAHPRIKKIIVKHIGSTNTLKSYLQSHEINAVASIGFPPDLALAFSEDKSLSDFTLHFKKSALYQSLFFNNEDDLLKNEFLRKALALSINKTEITKAFFNGKLNPAETIISENDSAFKKYQSINNIKSANELLEKNGWKLSSSGLRTKNGKILELTFKTSAGIKLYETIQVLICEQFRKIGVGCVIKNEPPRVLLGDSIPKGQYQIAMFGQNTYPDTSLKGLYLSKEIPTAKNSWAGGNIIRIKANLLDDLLIKYDTEWDSQKRIGLMQKIDRYLIDNYTLVPLYHRQESLLMPRQMSGIQSGFKGTAIVFPELWKM